MTDGTGNLSTPRTAPDGTAYVAAGRGQPLVLVHGVGMNWRVWAPQLASFTGGFRTIAYDLLGHGGSPLPPDPTELRHLSDQLARLLDHLGVEHAHIVGHSMGALVAIDFALRYPERVDRLVALNAVYNRSPGQRASVAERARELEDGDMDNALEATIERWFGPMQSRSNQDAIALARSWLQSVDRHGYACVYRRFAMADDAFVGRLAGLRTPALFLTGELDPNSTPEMSCRMAGEAPAGRAHVVQGERHMMALAAPELVNPHIRDFLQRAEAATTPSVGVPRNG